MLYALRLAFRGLWKRPAFAIVAVATLAIGLGSTTAVFSVVYGVLLRPLPMRDPDRVVYLRETRLPQFPSFSVSPGNFLTWQRETKTFEAMAATATAAFILTGSGEPERLPGARVTSDLFALLGVPPTLGRYFRPDEDRPGADPVVVISEGLWRRRFGSDPQVIGRVLNLNHKPYTIAGVSPASLTAIVGDLQLWVPMAFDEKEAALHGSHYLRSLGRLQPGVTLQEAAADLERVSLQLETAFPDSNRGWRVLITPTHEFLVRNVRTALIVLSAAVGLVLLAVCANVASLLLARGLARQREFAVRVALGAERGRLVRDLLAEGLALATLGGALGLLVAAGILRALRALAPATLPRISEIGFNPIVVLFAVGVALLAPLLFALLPAFQTSRANLRESLAAGGRSVRSALKAGTRTALVVTQIALAVVLLVGCTLLVRSFVRLLDVDPGFDPRHAITAALQIPAQKYPDPATRVQFQTRLMERLAALPGVDAVGLSASLPLVNDFVASLEFEGRPAVDPSDRPTTNFYSVSPGFFQAMGIRLIRGRGIEPTDRPGAPRVVVINESFVRRFFTGQDPIGQRIKVSQGPMDWREVVGVVADTKQYGLSAETPVQTYESYQQQPFSSVEVVLRTSLDPALLANDIRQVVRELDPEQPIGRIATLQRVVDDSLGSQRFSLALFSTFAAVALLLAVIGLYGLVAYSVSQQTQEIGIRMALGARPGDVLTLVIRQALMLAAAGIALGVGVALVATQLMRSLLFQTEVTDRATFVGIPLVLLVVIAIASWIPARRAARIDPLTALRSE
jgi:putative ABC transport system permease protein